MELADTPASEAGARKGVGVQLPPGLPICETMLKRFGSHGAAEAHGPVKAEIAGSKPAGIANAGAFV